MFGSTSVSSSALVLWSFFKATHCKKPLYLCLLQRGMFSEMSPIHVVLLSTLMNTPLASVYMWGHLGSVVVAPKEKKRRSKDQILSAIIYFLFTPVVPKLHDFHFLSDMEHKIRYLLETCCPYMGTKPKLDPTCTGLSVYGHIKEVGKSYRFETVWGWVNYGIILILGWIILWNLTTDKLSGFKLLTTMNLLYTANT